MRQEDERGLVKFTLTQFEVKKFNNRFRPPNMVTVFGRNDQQDGQTRLELGSDKAIETFKKLTKKAGIKTSGKKVPLRFFQS